jgi:protein CpxP
MYKGEAPDMFLKRNLLGILGLMFAFAIVGVAQEQSPATTPDDTHRGERSERKERHREGMGRHRGKHGHGMGRLMRELNLTDIQREQIRAITQRRLESTKTQREELSRLHEKRVAGTFTAEDAARAQTLRQEIHSLMEGVRAETEAILTAEQRTRLEQLKQERKAQHEERKVKRELRMKENQNQNQQ